MPGRLKAWVLAIGPAWVAFCGSLLLSLASLRHSTVNRDGMLYVEAARVFLEDGLRAATHIYSWPFLSILMAGLSRLTGLDYETSGYLLNILSLAGACGLLVASARRLFPQAAWHVCLVLLALPALNGYRDELLREYCSWFFIMLSFWLALRWADAPRWREALLAQLALALAALFRIESVALFPALVLWQWFEAPRDQRWRRVAMIGGPSLAALAVLAGLVAAGQLAFGRIVKDLRHLGLGQLHDLTAGFAGLLPDYGRDAAGKILVAGLLALVPLKFLAKMGVFLVPLAWPFLGKPFAAVLGRCRIFAWAFLAHLLVLAVVALELQYLAGRYVGALALFAAPLAGYGYWLMLERFPRWRMAANALLVLLALSNVISFHPPKYHFVEAGKWLAANAVESDRVYIESQRAAYYAGWRYKEYRPKRARLEEGLAEGRYGLVVLEVSRKRPLDEAWLGAAGLERVTSFVHPGGEAVVILRPAAAHQERMHADK